MKMRTKTSRLVTNKMIAKCLGHSRGATNTIKHYLSYLKEDEEYYNNKNT
jgi:hypothetical protein